MTQIIRKAKAMAMLGIIAALFSFTTGGGEGFEIYLNNRLLVQQFGNQMNNVKSIQLDNRFSNDQLVIKYHHCGHIGKNRNVTVRDEKNKILKEWKFADVAAASLAISDASMVCKVKDILGLQKNNSGKLGLYYSSSELPKGRLLVSITQE
jgi:hypothetical protein